MCFSSQFLWFVGQGWARGTQLAFRNYCSEFGVVIIAFTYRCNSASASGMVMSEGADSKAIPVLISWRLVLIFFNKNQRISIFFLCSSYPFVFTMPSFWLSLLNKASGLYLRFIIWSFIRLHYHQESGKRWAKGHPSSLSLGWQPSAPFLLSLDAGVFCQAAHCLICPNTLPPAFSNILCLLCEFPFLLLPP